MPRRGLDIEEGDDGAADAGDDEQREVHVYVLKVYRNHAGHDHQVEHEAADPVHKLIIYICASDHAVFPEQVQNDLHQEAEKQRPEEIQTPGEIRHGGDAGCAEQAHEKLRHGVAEDNKAQLHRQLIYGFGVRDLVFGFFPVLRAGTGNVAEGSVLALAYQGIEIDYAYNAADDKAYRGDSQTV